MPRRLFFFFLISCLHANCSILSAGYVELCKGLTYLVKRALDIWRQSCQEAQLTSLPFLHYCVLALWTDVLASDDEKTVFTLPCLRTGERWLERGRNGSLDLCSYFQQMLQELFSIFKSENLVPSVLPSFRVKFRRSSWFLKAENMLPSATSLVCEIKQSFTNLKIMRSWRSMQCARTQNKR